MKLVNIYIEECVKYLPRRLKEDVRLELKSELEEMIEVAMNEHDEEQAVKLTLESMGSPKHLADQYLNKQGYLIGPRYFDIYSKILKIVLLAMSIAFTVTYATKAFFTPQLEIWIIFEFLASLFNASIIAFAYVSAIFYIIERFEVKLDDKDLKDDTWTIKGLPSSVQDLPHHPVEHIFEIGFVFVAFFFINFQAHLIGVYFQSAQEWVITPILNELTRSSWIGLMNVWLLLLLLSGVIKAIVRLPRKVRLQGSIILDGLALVMFIIMVFTQSLINPNLAQSIAPGNEVFALMISRGFLAGGIIIIVTSASSWIVRIIRASKTKLDI
ncbi:MAG: hypothetical protein KGZ51_04995 [Erysipelothrix sp.]|jgi:hypothetical protein|nr:hypothetical protein [Erysipelothrix sp.]